MSPFSVVKEQRSHLACHFPLHGAIKVYKSRIIFDGKSFKFKLLITNQSTFSQYEKWMFLPTLELYTKNTKFLKIFNLFSLNLPQIFSRHICEQEPDWKWRARNRHFFFRNAEEMQVYSMQVCHIGCFGNIKPKLVLAHIWLTG